MSKQKALVYRPTMGKVLEIQVDQHPRYRAQRYGAVAQYTLHIEQPSYMDTWVVFCKPCKNSTHSDHKQL